MKKNIRGKLSFFISRYKKNIRGNTVVPGFFFVGFTHALAPPCRGVRSTAKSERLTNRAPTSYERLRKVPPLLEDFLEPL